MTARRKAWTLLALDAVLWFVLWTLFTAGLYFAK
jgi:hypothetical protein